MAKAKHQKAKPRRQAKQQHVPKKRGGKQNDVAELRAQLDTLGLKIIQVTADGNCFFRALADQLEGDEDEHGKYRSLAVQFIKNNREMFEPFVEDEVPFEEYCRFMGEDGTWAGHMELQAASLVTRSNICIHRNISYHDEEHYNSVRIKYDTCSGPARPIVLKGDAVLSANNNQPKAVAGKSKEEGRMDVVNEENLKLVKTGSGCVYANKVEQALEQVGVDAAVEVPVAEIRFLDQAVAGDEFFESERTSYDVPQCQNSEQHREKSGKLDSFGNGAEISCKKNSLQHDEKKTSRNKACPCGSKKKYKSCCGTVAGKASAKIPVNQTVDYGKSRKERKQGRKFSSTVMNSIQSDGGPLDMGALCI
ncbi:hypothetical protein OROGR_007890 [Orobanche gracilis]